MITDYARRLRCRQSDAEKLLWRFLRRKQLKGLRFRRQHPIGRYIVDFVCLNKKLIIEVDGGQHMENFKYDESRSRWLGAQGFKILRFWNHEVLGNIEGVLEKIGENL